MYHYLTGTMQVFFLTTSKTWTRTQDPDPEKHEPRKTWTLKTWTLKNLDPENPGPMKNLDPEKPGP